jgi:hypothetical protein
MNPFLRLVFVAALVCSGSALAQSVVKIVPGTADPWLAGMPGGSTASAGDSAPAQSPVQVDGAVNVALGGTLTFVVTGEVSYVPALQGYTPDGPSGLVTSHSTGVENGIASLTAPVSSLIGVFLDATQPNLAGPAPTSLDFSTAPARAYTTLSPALRQPFYIGDGLTGTGTGSVQVINVPTGATRLFLGSMDGSGWYNNAGEFSVTVTQTVAAPAQQVEIPTLSQWGVVLLAGLLGVLAVGLLRRRTR